MIGRSGLSANIKQLSDKVHHLRSFLSLIFVVDYLHCFQPLDHWGMMLVATLCGKSVWVSSGLAERAVKERGMDALKRLPKGWTMELENNELIYVNEKSNKKQNEPPV